MDATQRCTATTGISICATRRWRAGQLCPCRRESDAATLGPEPFVAWRKTAVAGPSVEGMRLPSFGTAVAPNGRHQGLLTSTFTAVRRGVRPNPCRAPKASGPTSGVRHEVMVMVVRQRIAFECDRRRRVRRGRMHGDGADRRADGGCRCRRRGCRHGRICARRRLLVSAHRLRWSYRLLRQRQVVLPARIALVLLPPRAGGARTAPSLRAAGAARLSSAAQVSSPAPRPGVSAGTRSHASPLARGELRT